MARLSPSQRRLLGVLARCGHASARECAEALYRDRRYVGAVDNIARALLQMEPRPVRMYSAGASFSLAITDAGRALVGSQSALDIPPDPVIE